MPEGKAAGVRCIHLLDDFKCALFGDPSRPKVCSDYLAEPDFCGENREEAMKILRSLDPSAPELHVLTPFYPPLYFVKRGKEL